MAIDSHKWLRPRMIASRSLGTRPRRCAPSNVVSAIDTRLRVIRLVADRDFFMASLAGRANERADGEVRHGPCAVRDHRLYPENPAMRVQAPGSDRIARIGGPFRSLELSSRNTSNGSLRLDASGKPSAQSASAQSRPPEAGDSVGSNEANLHHENDSPALSASGV